jgi:hypothetical protein
VERNCSCPAKPISRVVRRHSSVLLYLKKRGSLGEQKRCAYEEYAKTTFYLLSILTDAILREQGYLLP